MKIANLIAKELLFEISSWYLGLALILSTNLLSIFSPKIRLTEILKYFSCKSIAFEKRFEINDIDLLKAYKIGFKLIKRIYFFKYFFSFKKIIAVIIASFNASCLPKVGILRFFIIVSNF